MYGRSARRSFVVALVAGFPAVACASRQEAPPNPSVEIVQSLQGNWRLKSFAPQKPLEQPFQGLLDAQLKALTISFRGDQYFASGPGVNTQGRYEVRNAISGQFDATFFDPEGIAYPVSARFRGAELDFQSHNERWRGSGVLERAQETR
jgi:hypothetical protein